MILCGHEFRQLCCFSPSGGWHLLRIDRTIHRFV
nr:MAG TPA: hypothetical protein [Caudoviricetes sp.]DAL06189.1 MAG TPA: hypothetical protein [Caudoviricetes sp.]DAL90802.1 MAG TPA: hypothetical protein [Caudoviricetes sp.]